MGIYLNFKNMPVFFTSYYEKQYKAPCCSFSTIVTYLIYILAFFLPFLFVYRTGALWTKQAQYWEQPDVIFRNNLILEVLDKNGESS